MNIQVISYYSPNYSLYAAKLAESLRRWGVLSTDITIQPVKAFRSWHDGVSRKPQFIYEMLEQFSNCPGVLWLDADAFAVRHVPWDVLQGADVAAAPFQWSPGHRLEILTGTMYFANNQKVKGFVREWARLTEKQTASDTPEQDALLPLIKSAKGSVAFEALNVEWAFIDDDRVREQYPKAIPIFMHSQASRQIKAEEHRKSIAKKP
jgi:hypothetical protein